MTHYHVAVAISRTAKEGNKYTEVPLENVEFIKSILRKVPGEDLTLYHTDNRWDSVVEDLAYEYHTRSKQFPAYWFDPTKDQNRDKAAGYRAAEAMIRAAKDACYNKPEDEPLLLIFTTGTDDSTKHTQEYATKKGLQIRVFELPVKTQIETSPTANALPF